jgi:uncharacterized protein (TIGR02246 family)
MRFLFLLLALLAPPADARPDRTASDIRRTVQTFYDAFNTHDFRQLDRVTTTDWNHINPLGGRTIGRAAVLAELQQVHSTFLKGVTDTPVATDVEMVAPSVALVTVRSRTSDFTTPDGVRHTNEQQIRTFVVVERRGRWLITRDQNTFVR